MAYWNENEKPSLSMFGAVSRNGRFEVWVISPKSDSDDNEYRLFVKRWVLHTEPQIELEWPQGWNYLWPEPSIRVISWSEAREKQLSLVRKLDTNTDDTHYVEIPNLLNIVEVIEHEDRQWLARIYRHADGKYEIKYFKRRYGRNVYYWANVRNTTLTFADTLTDAQTAANEELGALRVNIDGFRRGSNGWYTDIARTL